jgi:ADP-ribose pyrophosphatase YjhB (NUDIX family)
MAHQAMMSHISRRQESGGQQEGRTHVFYLPGGKPESGESAEQTLFRELSEKLGVVPGGLALLAHVDEVAALEGAPMRMTVLTAGIDRPPRARGRAGHAGLDQRGRTATRRGWRPPSAST